MRKKPADLLSSVDAALRLLHLLRDEGTINVTAAASSLGVSVSSAHRLLATLVYRDFATRTDSRVYVAGPALSLSADSRHSVLALRDALLPAMRHLAGTFDETLSLGIRIGSRMRCVASAEGRRLLRVGDQEGTVLPAHSTANGRVLLAALDTWALRRLYESQAVDFAQLQRRLAQVRRTGFALNRGEAEEGVSAVAVPVPDETGEVVAALAITLPDARFAGRDVQRYVDEMSIAIDSHRPRASAMHTPS